MSEAGGKKRRWRWVVLTLVLGALAYQIWRYHDERILPKPDALDFTEQTAHFVVHSDLDRAQLAEQARIYEGFSLWFEQRYFSYRQSPPLVVYLFGDDLRYTLYNFRHGTVRTPFGFYDPRLEIAVLNHISGLGTAAHEIVHHFIVRGMPRKPPPWIDEGFAAFFEKMIGHFDADGRLELSVGYFNPWRFEIVKRSRAKLDLRSLVEAKDADQSAARSFMLFLHKRRLLERFIQRIARGEWTASAADALTAVYGQALETIDGEWKAWIDAQPLDDEVNLLPRSFVLSEAEWNRWLAENQHRVVWSEPDAIFRPRR